MEKNNNTCNKKKPFEKVLKKGSIKTRKFFAIKIRIYLEQNEKYLYLMQVSLNIKVKF